MQETLTSYNSQELSFSTTTELQPMRIVDFNASAEEKLSYTAINQLNFT